MKGNLDKPNTDREHDRNSESVNWSGAAYAEPIASERDREMLLIFRDHGDPAA